MLSYGFQIRARRLAKLGTSTPVSAKSDENKIPDSESSNPSRTSTPKPQADADSRPKINITSSAPAASSSQNPFNKLGVKAEPPKPTADRASPKPVNTQPESDVDYADRVLSQIFRITVDPHNMINSHGQRLTFLPNLNEELNESGEPLKLSLNTLDQALMEAASSYPQEKPLMNYFLPCWKRAVKASIQHKATEGTKFEVHEEAKRLCMSGCLFALTMPDLYG
jgi:ubiquitin conjugation factor E4 B